MNSCILKSSTIVIKCAVSPLMFSVNFCKLRVAPSSRKFCEIACLLVRVVASQVVQKVVGHFAYASCEILPWSELSLPLQNRDPCKSFSVNHFADVKNRYNSLHRFVRAQSDNSPFELPAPVLDLVNRFIHDNV